MEREYFRIVSKNLALCKVGVHPTIFSSLINI
jgi:hypothetical protein